MKNMHGYLRKLKERGEPMPENEEELSYLIRRDRPTTRKQRLDDMKRSKHFTKAKLKKRLKWGPRKRL